MIYAILWLVGSGFVGWLSMSRGRGFLLGFVASLALSPAIGLAIVMVLKPTEEIRREEIKEEERIRAEVRDEIERERRGRRSWPPDDRNG